MCAALLPVPATEPGTSSVREAYVLAEWIESVVWHTPSSDRKLGKAGLGAHEGSGRHWSPAGDEEVIAVAEEHRSGNRGLQWEVKKTTGQGKFLKGGNPLASSGCPVAVSQMVNEGMWQVR